MDAFRLRETVVADYADYVQSFLAILDPRIRAFVDERLADGMLWPDPLLQLSPAYQSAETVEERVFFASAGALQFLVLDELRTYRFNLSSGPLCVFCDETPPAPRTLDQRADLEDIGYAILAVRPDDDLDPVVRRLAS